MYLCRAKQKPRGCSALWNSTRALLIALFSFRAASRLRFFDNQLASRWQPRCHGSSL
jgi:hypothetical protein